MLGGGVPAVSSSLPGGSACHTSDLLPGHNPGAPTSLPLQIHLQNQCAQTPLQDLSTLPEGLLEKAAAPALKVTPNLGCNTLL